MPEISMPPLPEHTAFAQHKLSSSNNLETLNTVLKLNNKVMTPFSTFLERQHKISLNEFRLLMLIGRHPGSASHELVEMSGVTPMSVSRAVTTLHKHGRIATDRDPTNGRRKIHFLTEEGRKLFEYMLPLANLVADYLVLPLNSSELNSFNDLISKLMDGLEKTDAEGKSAFLEYVRPK